MNKHMPHEAHGRPVVLFPSDMAAPRGGMQDLLDRRSEQLSELAHPRTLLYRPGEDFRSMVPIPLDSAGKRADRGPSRSTLQSLPPLSASSAPAGSPLDLASFRQVEILARIDDNLRRLRQLAEARRQTPAVFTQPES
jgi:hypothetical protein